MLSELINTGPTLLALSAIVNDGGTQMRAGMNAEKVKEYEELLRDANGWPFDDPVVVYYDGSKYWLADGFHRLNAVYRSGTLQEIPAEIKAGTRRDAVKYACGANAKHGLPRTNEDKRRAVTTMLEDEEWSRWSDGAIAKACAVSQPFVSAMRREMTQNGFESAIRTGADGRTINTTNIGANRPAPPAMFAVWELETTVRNVYAQVYGGNPEPFATRDMRTGAQMRAGRFWLLCTQSLPANQFRLSDLAQAINNVAEQMVSRQHAPVPTTTIAPTVAYVVPAVDGDLPLPAWAADDSPAAPVGHVSNVTEPATQAATPAGDELVETLRTHFNAPLPTASSDPWLTAATAPVRRQERAALLADALQPWIGDYNDEYGRNWQHLAEHGNPSHSNSTFWQDIQRECQRRNVRIDDDILKGAIKQAFATMLAQHQAEAPATVADGVEVHDEPAPPADPTEPTPVSQRADYESDEWYTPAEYIEAARTVMGAIDLDPASSEMAQTVVRANVYLTRFDDGLRQSRWIHQRIWLNPPYSNPAPWIEKLVREHQAGPFCTEAIVLVNNATETSWFQLLLERYPVCLPARRIAFWRHDHANVGARQGQAFFYLGPNAAKFQEIFSQFGPILRRLS